MITASPPTLSHIAELVLVRMVVPAKKPPSPSAICKSLAAIIGHSLSTTEFSQHKDQLANAGLIEVRTRGGMLLTEAGRARALEFLGVTELSPKMKWPTIQGRYLVPRALALPPASPQSLDDAKKLTAFLIKQRFGLPVGGTLNQALAALVCQKLGFAKEATLRGLLCAVLSRLIGAEVPLTTKQLETQMATWITGAKNADLKSLRKAIIQKWAGKPIIDDEQAPDFDLPTFATTVTALARRCPADGWFGDNKVFIVAVWRAAQQEPGFPKLDLVSFKTRLIEANSAGLLALSRADLVQAMDPTLVADSETKYLNAEFHFVLLP